MDSARRAAAGVLGVIGLAAVAFAAPAAAPRLPRAGLEALQASVEAAVTRVSRPAGLMFGRPSRAYHLKGYGAIIVLAPRALPRVRRHAADGPEGRAIADLLGRLQRSLEDVSDPEERRRLEETLVVLRNWPPSGRPLRMRAPPPRPGVAPRDIESLQEEAEAFRREAERAMEKAERDVLLRLRVPEDGRPFVFRSPPTGPEAPAPLDVPHPEDVPPPLAPGAPGWPFWFGEVDAEDAPPERVLAEVRRAIVAGLGAYRGGLAPTAPDEFVVVAVDFVPRMADHGGSRTVVARARQRDLVDYRAGRLSVDALQARVEFDEY